ncbi:MAG TPA: transglutaminase domain-containing protein [Gemmataceae bacterium]|nr:transglutaminase domain-containing protein [Gemmataceae bacterium]
MTPHRLCIAVLLLVLLPAVGCVHAEAPADVRSRTFQFTYAAVVTGLKPDQPARIWLPIAHSGDDQVASIVAKELPAEGKIGRDADYGNEYLYLDAKADADGKVPLKIVYKATRRELKGDGGKEVKESADLLARYLRADAKVPIDGKPLDMLRGKDVPKDQLAVARVIYDAIDDSLKYGKDKPGWGEGDSVWACDNRTGNCTDFHSLFMTLARSRGIPAKFEIGFPIPDKHGAGDVAGYHCWAKFRPEGKGWFPVDISEANKHPEMRDYYFGNLTENRLAFTTGRDLTLAPKQDGGPVNFLIYPYVEVDGKVWPQDKIEKKFTYQDE